MDITLDKFDEILSANNFSRICANSWVYRSDYCNVYLDIIEGECELRFETTGTNLIFISHQQILKQFNPNTIGSSVATIADILSQTSQRTISEIQNTLSAIPE